MSIRRDGCSECLECGAFIAASASSRLCVCGHVAAKHIPHYQNRFPGQPTKGGLKRTGCVGFGSSELQWAFSTPCDGCQATWLQHELPSSPAKSTTSNAVRPNTGTTIASGTQNPINRTRAISPQSIFELSTEEEEDMVDRRGEEAADDDAVPDPDVQILSLDQYKASISTKAGPLQPKMPAREAYAIANKRRVNPHLIEKAKHNLKPTLSVNQPNSRKRKNPFLDQGGSQTCSPRTEGNKEALISRIRLWIQRFPEGYERLRLFNLLVHCNVPKDAKSRELWRIFDEAIREKMAEIRLSFNDVPTSIAWSPQDAAWSVVSIGRRTRTGHGIHSSSQTLHHNNFNLKTLLQLSGPLDKDLKARLSAEDQPDILLAAAFTRDIKSGYMPSGSRLLHAPEFEGPHSADCFQTHCFYGLLHDENTAASPPECKCPQKTRGKGKKPIRHFIPSDEEDGENSREKMPSGTAESKTLSNAPNRMSGFGEPRAPPTMRWAFMQTGPPSPPPLDSDEDLQLVLQPRAPPRFDNPFRRALSPPPANQHPMFPLPSRHARSRLAPGPSSVLPFSAPRVHNDQAFSSIAAAIGASSGQLRIIQVPPPTSGDAVILSEPGMFDDGSVRDLQKQLEALSDESRTPATIMELQGDTIEGCSRTLLLFFKEYSRAFHIAGYNPNPNMWQVAGATLGPENVRPIDTFRSIRTISLRQGAGRGPTREIASHLMQLACEQPDVCRASHIEGTFNLDLTSLGGSNVERSISFTTLGICAAWHIAVAASAPLPLSPLEIMVALGGTLSLLNEELILICSPEVHKDFYPIWNRSDVGPSYPIPLGHPLNDMITDRLEKVGPTLGQSRSQQRQDEIGAMLLSKLTNGNGAGCFGDSPLHQDFTAFKAGLFMEMDTNPLRGAWPADLTAAANLICALTPLPSYDPTDVLKRLEPHYSPISSPTGDLERTFVDQLRGYLLGIPAHPLSHLFAHFVDDEEYEKIQQDTTYRSRCLLYLMTGLDVIPRGSSWELEIYFVNRLPGNGSTDDSETEAKFDLIRFGACGRSMHVYLTTALQDMLESPGSPTERYPRIILWLHEQIATSLVTSRPGRVRYRSKDLLYNTV